jgi:hypothetical protein
MVYVIKMRIGNKTSWAKEKFISVFTDETLLFELNN